MIQIQETLLSERIPETMDAEYLRLVGILMRVFRNESLRCRLVKAKHVSEIIETFAKEEMQVS